MSAARQADGPFDRAAGRFATAAVAHERADSTRAGWAMLEAGGNAVDAAVAVAFAACVVMPASTTIAGSGFLLVQPGPGEPPVAIEFPPRAPLAATPDLYALEDDPERTLMMGVSAVAGDANVVGGLAVGVPAAVAGLCEAHARFGRLALADVVAPAIALARDGFAVDADYQLTALSLLEQLRDAGPALRESLLTADGLPPTAAPTASEPPRIVQAELAATLERIARDGPAGFYRGETADAIVAEVGRRGGILSHEDLAHVEALVTEPLALRVAGATLFAPRSPNGGWTELQILGVLARLGALDGEDPLDLRTVLELSRRCFADRFHFLADPDHVDVPLDTLLSDGYLDALAAAVRDTLSGAGPATPYPGELPWTHFATRVPEPFARHRPDLVPTPWASAPGPSSATPGDSFETTHLAVVDADGMAVTCTITAADLFGSRVSAAGVLLDDAMIWFNATPGVANSIGPWKRPLANMGPLLVVHDDGRTLAVGAPGGRRIISAVAQVAAHWLRGDNVEQATAQPRIDGSGGGAVLVSGRAAAAQVAALEAAGHIVQLVEDRDPRCVAFARPVAAATTRDGRREAAIQPFVAGTVIGR